MPLDLIEKVNSAFIKRFKEKPITVNSPGRINILGEHIDYNGGITYPAAIDKSIVLALGVNNENIINVVSLDYNEEISLDANSIIRPLGNWSDYILGVVKELNNHGKSIKGFDIVFSGNIPLGSGLSSSAALECGVAFGLNKLFSLKLTKYEIATLSQMAENNFVGVQCGLMDQYASTFGKESNLLQLNLRNNTHKYLKMDLTNHEFILCNSGVKHSFSAGDEYNNRRRECDAGLAILKAKFNIEHLVDATADMLETIKSDIAPEVFKRSKYVSEEYQRVLEVPHMLHTNDLRKLGESMYETHKGLSSLFEVSCPELDFLIDTVSHESFVLGARLMGGGFGGCTINLVEKGHLEYFTNNLKEKYNRKFNIDLEVYQVKISDGVHIINSNL